MKHHQLSTIARVAVLTTIIGGGNARSEQPAPSVPPARPQASTAPAVPGAPGQPPVVAGDFTAPLVEGPYSYTVKDGAVTIVKYNGPGGDVVIPEKIAKLPVDAIGDNAFNGCAGLTGVTIFKRVTRIGEMAFYGCSQLTNVAIPDSVHSIGAWAFMRCYRLASVTIPASVTSLGRHPFRDCGAIAVDPDNPAFICGTDGVVFDKKKTCVILCPTEKSGHYEIPDGVTRIEKSAFRGCSKLTRMTIPGSVAELGDCALRNCTRLDGIYFKGDAPKLGVAVLSNDTKAIVYHLPTAKGWGKEFDGRPTAVWDGKTMPKDAPAPPVSVPTPVPVPQSGAASPAATAAGPFTYTTANGAVTIVKYTGQGKNVVIPDKINGQPVTGIGGNAFIGCATLLDVTIPASVTSMGGSAFSNCPNLTGVHFSGNAPSLGQDVFHGSTKSIIHYLPTTKGWCKEFGGRPTKVWDPKMPPPTPAAPPGVPVPVPPAASAPTPGSAPPPGAPPAPASGVPAPAATAGPFTYTTDKGTVVITKYTGPGGDVTIPITINGLPVTGIGTRAFDGCSGLTAITIPQNITRIGPQAFAHCTALTNANLPQNDLSIGYDAFRKCTKLANSIRDRAPRRQIVAPGCPPTTQPKLNDGDYEYVANAAGQATITKFKKPSVGSLSIPSTLGGCPVTSIGNEAFRFCKGLTSVIIPEGVTHIGNLAFYDCSELAVVTLPNSLTDIGYGAFAQCEGLTGITIPVGVINLDSAFFDCSDLTAINVVEENMRYSSLNGVLFDKEHTTLIAYPAGKTEMYEIPEGVTEIKSNAFSHCFGLAGVVMPASVRRIGNGAFYRCDGLRAFTVNSTNPCYLSVEGVLFNKEQTYLIRYPADKTGSYTIPTSVTTIGYDAFNDCSGLNGITITPSITEIKSGMFAGCTSLTAISVDASNPKYSSLDGIVYNKDQTMLVRTPVGKAGRCVIPFGVKTIGPWAFHGCTRLTGIQFPTGVTRIEPHAFYQCAGLIEITLGVNVATIGESAFAICSGLTNVTLGADVTRIDKSAFYYCTGLTGVYFNGNAPSIDASVFNGASKATIYYLSSTTGWDKEFGGRPTKVWDPKGK